MAKSSSSAKLKQLHVEAGILDIVVVKPATRKNFYYLEDKYGVNIVVNRAYAERKGNNNLTHACSRATETPISAPQIITSRKTPSRTMSGRPINGRVQPGANC